MFEKIDWLEELHKKLFIPSAGFNSHLKKMMEDARILQEQHKSVVTRALSDFTSLSRTINETQAVANIAAKNVMGLSSGISGVNAISKHYEMYANMIPKIPSINESMMLTFQKNIGAHNFAVKKILDLEKVLGGKFEKNLINDLLAPYKVMSEFGTQKIKALIDSSAYAKYPVIKKSFDFLNSQLYGSANVLDRVTELEGEATSEYPEALDFNSVKVQFDDLNKTADITNFKTIKSFKISQKTREVIDITLICNELSIKILNVNIFKTTNTVLKAVNHLPWICANDEGQFSNVIRMLYFIFYEGAGDDNLRFLSKNGGVLDREDCSFIWRLKTFRNNWLQHDPDHGGNSKIKKKAVQLQESLEYYGFELKPYAVDEFEELHLKVLEDAERFVTSLVAKLQYYGSTSSPN